MPCRENKTLKACTCAATWSRHKRACAPILARRNLQFRFKTQDPPASIWIWRNRKSNDWKSSWDAEQTGRFPFSAATLQQNRLPSAIVRENPPTKPDETRVDTPIPSGVGLGPFRVP